MTREQCVEFLSTYGLMTLSKAESKMKFIEEYGAYIINYSIGESIINESISRHPSEKTWNLLQWVILTLSPPMELVMN